MDWKWGKLKDEGFQNTDCSEMRLEITYVHLSWISKIRNLNDKFDTFDLFHETCLKIILIS